MTIERIKEIHSKTAYPNSVSVQQALLQVKHECEQEVLHYITKKEKIKNKDIITYKIDNHSNILPLKLLKECYTYSINTHYRYRKQEYLLKRELIGCYILYDEHKNVIYIGKSLKCIRGRLLSHCFTAISEYLSEKEKAKVLLKRKKSKYFSFIEVNKKMLDFVECGLINKYQPILNVNYVN